MDYFLVYPDFDILSKYYSFQYPIEEMKLNYVNGYAIVIDSYRNQENEWFFCGDHVKQVEDGFRDILCKYDLLEHYNNLLFLALNKKYEIDQISFALEDEYLPQKRVQELAKLVLAFKTTAEGNLISLNLKTGNNDNSPIIKDQKLIGWIGKLLLDAIEEGKEPINLFSLTGDTFLRGSTDQLKEMANKKFKSPYVGRKKYLADFCFYLHPYLVEQTAIRPDVKTLVSDNQINFYFDTLVLFDMLNPKQIDSEPKDYMRTLLKNHIRKLNS